MSGEPRNAIVDIVNADTTGNSELVLDLVMSYLPTEDCVRTSILSSRWRYRWTTIPSLVFDLTCCSRSRMYQREALTNVINHVLLLHSGAIEVFQVRDIYAVPDIDRWILRASKDSIKTLVLELRWGWKTLPYELPSSLFTCRNLSSLKLTNCLLTPPPSSFKGFKNLKYIKLESVTLTDDAFEKLISSCPLLKELTLSELTQRDTVQYQLPSLLYTCWSLSSLKLVSCLLMPPPSSFKGFRNLRSLELRSVTLTIDALEKLISSCCPLLKELSLSMLKQWDTVQYQLPSLLYTCSSLSSLELEYCSLMPPPSSFKGFNNLKSLELMSVTLTDDALEKLISSCPLLKKLGLYAFEGANNLKINATNLQHVEIYGDFVSITFGCAMTMLLVVCIFAPECAYAGFLDLFIKLPDIQQLELDDCHMGFASGDSIAEGFPFQCQDLSHLAISMDCSFVGGDPTLYLHRGSFNLTEEHILLWDNCYLVIELGMWEENSSCHHEFKQLRRVRVNNFCGTKAELEFLKFVLGNSPVLEEMKVKPSLESARVRWEDVKSIYEFKRASKAKILFDELVTQICRNSGYSPIRIMQYALDFVRPFCALTWYQRYYINPLVGYLGYVPHLVDAIFRLSLPLHEHK